MKCRCDNCNNVRNQCPALNHGGIGKKAFAKREIQCAENYKPVDISKPIFD